jgi:hypothetical protein
VARHGLHGLQVYRPIDLSGGVGAGARRGMLMGVSPAGGVARRGDAQADGCGGRVARGGGVRARYAAVCSRLADEVAAVSGNLERLSLEYRARCGARAPCRT